MTGEPVESPHPPTMSDECEHEWDERGYPYWPRCMKCKAMPPMSDEPTAGSRIGQQDDSARRREHFGGQRMSGESPRSRIEAAVEAWWDTTANEHDSDYPFEKLPSHIRESMKRRAIAALAAADEAERYICTIEGEAVGKGTIVGTLDEIAESFSLNGLTVKIARAHSTDGD